MDRINVENKIWSTKTYGMDAKQDFRWDLQALRSFKDDEFVSKFNSFFYNNEIEDEFAPSRRLLAEIIRRINETERNFARGYFTTKKIPVPGSNQMVSKVVSLDSIKGNYVTILCSLDESKRINDNIMTIPSKFERNDIHSSKNMSGFLVLMMAKLQKDQVSDKISFNSQLFKKAKYSKPNIIDKSKKNQIGSKVKVADFLTTVIPTYSASSL